MSNYPAWRYGPGGESRVFNSETEVPKGWRDTPYVAETPAADRNPLADDLKAAQDRAEAAEADVTRLGEEIEDKNRTIATQAARIDDLEAEVAKFDPDGNGRVGGSKPADESDQQPVDVEIPADWADMHWTQRVKLAKAVRGSDDEMTDVEAKAVIASEVERRAAIAETAA